MTKREHRIRALKTLAILVERDHVPDELLLGLSDAANKKAREAWAKLKEDLVAQALRASGDEYWDTSMGIDDPAARR